MCSLPHFDVKLPVGACLSGNVKRDLIPIPCSLLLSLGNSEAAVYFDPVDHVPPCGQVVGATVLVLQVVGVFPHVIEEHRIQAL